MKATQEFNHFLDGYVPPEMEWYVLKRGEEYQLAYVTKGNDPTYGAATWSLYAGPFASAEEAEAAIP